MSTPIEALAQEYAEVFIQELYDLPKSALPKLEIEVKSVAAAYIAGARAASGQGEARIKELETLLLRTYKALDEATNMASIPDHVKDDHEHELERECAKECMRIGGEEIMIRLVNGNSEALSGAGKGEGHE